MEAFRGEANLMRHPRSFPLKGELWSHLKSCDERRRRVAYGQTLYKVNEQLKATVRKSASTGALPPATLERCPRVESKQAAKDDGKTLKSRLHFGASVALQAPSTQELVTVKNSSASVDDGKMMACPIESVSSPDVTLFRIMSMNDPTSCKAVHFGDSVWLQIFGGNGEPSWRNGSVVGAKVHQASWLPTVPLATSRNTALLVRSKEETSNNNNTTKIMGMPIPIRATLPKGKEDAAWSFHEMRQRNQNALTLGRWRIMPASDELAAEAVERGGYVCNDDPIYLEQDFLYICRDQGSHLLSFHRISPRDQSGSGGYRVERRGIWQIKVADASTSLREMSKIEQRSEMLMEKARKILQQSDGNRHGKRKYCEDESLCSAGGATFSVGLRENPEMQRAAREESALRMHASKESSPHEYFAAKFPKVGPQIMHPQKHERDDGSVVTTKAAYSYGARVSRSRINRQNSEPLLPSFKQQRKDLFGRGSGGAAVDEASSTDSATHFLNLSTVSSAQIRKSRLLSNAASWPYALYKEDETVAQQRRCLQSRHDSVADPGSSRLSPRRCRESRSCDEMLSSCSRITIDGSLMEKKSTTTTGSCGRFASVSQVGNDEARSMRRGGEHPIRQRLREADDFLKKVLCVYFSAFGDVFPRISSSPSVGGALTSSFRDCI